MAIYGLLTVFVGATALGLYLARVHTTDPQFTPRSTLLRGLYFGADMTLTVLGCWVLWRVT